MLICLLKYNLKHVLIDFIMGRVKDTDPIKARIKKIIRESEVKRWKITLFMYPALDDYHHCVHDHKLYIWWKYVDEFPNMYHYVSALMAVLMGGNPKTLQCNHSSIICRLCETSSLEIPAHFLFACPTLEDTRRRTWSCIMHW